MDDYLQDDEGASLESECVSIRNLTLDDLDSVVRIDEASTGISRSDFYQSRIKRSLEESSIHLSLAAELDGMVVGFLTVTFFHGEFGMPYPVAVLDALGVHPEFRKQAIASALMNQLETNLRALRVEAIRTEVDWDQFDLMGFLRNSGFRPAPRLVLEKRLDD